MKDKALKAKQNLNIISSVCALLNSGGGIVLVRRENEDYVYDKHSLGLDIENALTDIVDPSQKSFHCDFMQRDGYLYIFVKTWSNSSNTGQIQRICSLATSIFTRDLSSTYKASPMNVMKLIDDKQNKQKNNCPGVIIKKSKKSPNIPSEAEVIGSLLKRDSLLLGEIVPLSESQHVELKEFGGPKCEVRIKELLPKYISAFANKDGGYLIIGVSDKEKKVTGCGKGIEVSKFEAMVKHAMGKLKRFHFCSPQDEDVSCHLYSKDVLDASGIHFGYVLFLEIKTFCCLVFHEDPNSWIVEADQPKQLHVAQWMEMMMMNKKEDSGITDLISQFNPELNPRYGPPLTKPVYSKKGQESLQEVQRNLFGVVEDQIRIKPEGLYNELCREIPDLKDLMEKLLPKTGGVLILSRSLAVDVGQKCHQNVVCDALLIATGSYPTLYTLLKTETSLEDFHYLRSTAYAIKQKLVNIGGYSGRLCVLPKPLLLQSENANPDINWPDVVYPASYKLDSIGSVQELLRSLLIIMLSFKSLVSDQIGIEFFSLLTTEQYNLLSKCLHKSNHLFVHGLPGSGKTSIALMIMKKIKNEFDCTSENILYICENRPLKEYVGSKKICLAVTRSTFMENFFHVEDIKHIIVDEAQNFRTEKSDWYQKAKRICQETGVFWIFLDHFQTSHPYKSGLPPLPQQNKEFLTTVVRNATDIYNVMMQPMNEIASSNTPQSIFLRRLLKDSKCAHQVKGFYEEQNSLEKKEVAEYVAQTCNHYLKHGYMAKHIAILCNTCNDVEAYKEMLSTAMRKYRLPPCVEAWSVREDVFVLDSIRCFSGLERSIVFAINPVPLQSEVTSNILLCAVSRAYTKLHVLYEKRPIQ
ncbi:hypothetical protein FKM82_008733 [Ascaphus truei]